LKSPALPITIDNIRKVHKDRRQEIRRTISAFRAIWKTGDNDRLWEEMVFCFFTGGCSARMGLNSIEAVRPILKTGSHEELMNALVGRHRYPRARSRYIVESREFLMEDCDLDLRTRLTSFRDRDARRDWLAKTKGIKGLGYKEASHYLRNIGFTGYGILDKHILNCLAELELIAEPKPPSNRTRYLETEQRLRELSSISGIDFDELDLVLWSMKTGEILK